MTSRRIIPIADAHRQHCFPTTGFPHEAPLLGERVEIQLFTTLSCNISCDYCVMAVGDVLGSQGKPQYSIPQLKQWTQTHALGKQLAFTFFGGEPLLNRPFIREVIDAFPEASFQLQTNGTLLAKTDPDILQAMSHFLVSIDGPQEITDRHRGHGIHASILRNVEQTRAYTQGRLTARMTWLDDSIQARHFSELLDVFDHVHFQFAQDDRGYSPDSLAAKERAVDGLAELFFSTPGGLDIVPIMGILRNLARPDLAEAQCAHGPHCRVSHALANVRPDGLLFGCPDMTWNEAMAHGSIQKNQLARSPLRMTSNMPCSACEASTWCRGNCMKNLWRAYEMNDLAYRSDVVEPVCSLVRRLGQRIVDARPSEWLGAQTPSRQNAILFHPSFEWTEVIP